MAIDLGTENLSVSTQERTRQITIKTTKGVDPFIVVERENVRLLPDGTVLSRSDVGPVERRLSQIQAQAQPFKPATSGMITGGELAGLLAQFADAWRQEDIVAEQAKAAAQAEAEKAGEGQE